MRELMRFRDVDLLARALETGRAPIPGDVWGLLVVLGTQGNGSALARRAAVVHAVDWCDLFATYKAEQKGTPWDIRRGWYHLQTWARQVRAVILLMEEIR